MPRAVVADARSYECARLESVLKAAGFETFGAGSARELDALLARNAVDAVVCDVALDAESAAGLVRRLRASLLDRSAPLIMMSEERTLAERVDCLRAGATDYAVKPVHEGILMRSLVPTPPLEPADVPARILVVDDSSTYGHALSDELTRDGHDVVLATTVREARAYLTVQVPDLALLDVFLPDGDGVELAKSMRAQEGTRDLPILMLTGRESTHIRQRAAEAQVSGFAAKSTPLAELRREVWAVRSAKRQRFFKGEAGAPRGERRPVSGRELFARVIAASGLSEVLGRSTLELALRRAGFDSESLSAAELEAALPQIEQVLTTFLPKKDAQMRLSAIATLVTEGSSKA